jgi:hypothetical protein
MKLYKPLQSLLVLLPAVLTLGCASGPPISEARGLPDPLPEAVEIEILSPKVDPLAPVFIGKCPGPDCQVLLWT